MNLIKKHYEKFIFIILLLAFVTLFGLQAYNIISQQDENPEDKLKINLGEPDYKSVKFDDSKFSAFQVFSDATLRFQPNTKQKISRDMDFAVPPRLARCPNGAHLIPISDFPKKEGDKNKKCSYCEAPLEEIPVEILEGSGFAANLVDSDQDGIPDAEEIKMGLNPKDSNDARQDKDNDGFTNLEEYRAKTDISNPKSRPSYASRLSVREVKQQPLGIRVKRFRGDKPGQTDAWTVNMEYKVVNRGKERFRQKNMKIGDVLEAGLENPENFTLERIEESFGTNQETGKPDNQSVVWLKRESDGVMIPAKAGEWLDDPNKTVILYFDVPFVKEKEITTVIGKEFSVGDEQRGLDKFVVISADASALSAKLKDIQGKVEDLSKCEIRTGNEMGLEGGMQPGFNGRPGEPYLPQGNRPRNSGMPQF